LLSCDFIAETLFPYNCDILPEYATTIFTVSIAGHLQPNGFWQSLITKGALLGGIGDIGDNFVCLHGHTEYESISFQGINWTYSRRLHSAQPSDIG
jgi:hypothetical protein